MIVGTAALLVAAQGASSQTPRTRVLFICQYGTVKSAIAREVFRKRARERGIAVTSFSRGITPEEHVSPALRAHLKADGIDTAHDPVRMLAVDDLQSADIVVILNPLPKGMAATNIRDWTALPSMNDAYPAARADLLRRIDVLLDTIALKHRQ